MPLDVPPAISEKVRKVPPIVWIVGAGVLVGIAILRRNSGGGTSTVGVPTATGVSGGGGGGSSSTDTGTQGIIPPDQLNDILLHVQAADQAYITAQVADALKIQTPAVQTAIQAADKTYIDQQVAAIVNKAPGTTTGAVAAAAATVPKLSANQVDILKASDQPLNAHQLHMLHIHQPVTLTAHQMHLLHVASLARK